MSDLPTLDDFLTWKWPLNSYVKHLGMKSLYVRSGGVWITMGEDFWFCDPVVQIGSVDAIKPGQGAFTALVDHIIGLGRAIYVENVHNPRFRRKLLELGFVEVNEGQGAPNYLYNFDGRLKNPEPCS